MKKERLIVYALIGIVVAACLVTLIVLAHSGLDVGFPHGP